MKKCLSRLRFDRSRPMVKSPAFLAHPVGLFLRGKIAKSHFAQSVAIYLGGDGEYNFQLRRSLAVLYRPVKYRIQRYTYIYTVSQKNKTPNSWP